MRIINLVLTAGGKKILFCGCAHNGILNVMETLERKCGKFLPWRVVVISRDGEILD